MNFLDLIQDTLLCNQILVVSFLPYFMLAISDSLVSKANCVIIAFFLHLKIEYPVIVWGEVIFLLERIYLLATRSVQRW